MNNDYNNWKNFRIYLTDLINIEEEKIEKTTHNIYNMYLKSGLKSTARYFNIQNSQVLYHVKKYKDENKIE